MAFGTGSVVFSDDFDYADTADVTAAAPAVWENPLWTGQGPCRVVSSELAPGPTSTGWLDCYSLDEFDDLDLIVTLAAKPGDTLDLFIHARATPESAGGVDSYTLRLEPESGTDQIRVQRWTNGSSTTLATYSLEFSAGDRFGLRLIGDQIEAYHDDGSGWDLLGSAITDATYSTGAIAFESNSGATRISRVEVREIDTTAPAVDDSTPADAATDVAIDVAPSVTFTEALAPATVDDTTVTLEDTGGAVSGTVSLSSGDTVVTFTPDAVLEYETEHTLTLAAAIEDPAGNALAGAPVEITFTTAAAPAMVDDVAQAAMTATRDLEALLQVAKTAGTGVRILRRAGAGESPPGTPDAAGWALVEDLAESSAEILELSVALPTNDDDYTLALWAFAGEDFSPDPHTVTVFGTIAPTMAAVGDNYAAFYVDTDRPGKPRVEVSPFGSFVTSDVYDAHDDGEEGWRIGPPGSENLLASSSFGDPLPSGGWPADSAGSIVRRELPVVEADRYVRALHRLEET